MVFYDRCADILTFEKHSFKLMIPGPRVDLTHNFIKDITADLN